MTPMLYNVISHDTTFHDAKSHDTTFHDTKSHDTIFSNTKSYDIKSYYFVMQHFVIQSFKT